MDPQKNKEILNKKNKAGGITSTDLKIQCSYSDQQNRTAAQKQNRQPGNRPTHQYPAVFVVVCLLGFVFYRSNKNSYGRKKRLFNNWSKTNQTS